MNFGTPAMANAVAYAPYNVRAEFIRKVYNLFFVSLLVTVGVGWFATEPSALPGMIGLRPVLLIGEFVCIFALMFARRTTGVNVFLLYLFAAIQGALLGPLLLMLDRYAPGIPAQAAVLTVATFGGLSLYAMQSRKDFSYLGGMLFVGLIALIVAGIVMIFVQSSLMSMVYSVIGILIFSGYVLYDTSLIMTKLAPDEAIAGAISLYLDLLNLFFMILNLLMEMNRRD